MSLPQSLNKQTEKKKKKPVDYKNSRAFMTIIVMMDDDGTPHIHVDYRHSQFQAVNHAKFHSTNPECIAAAAYQTGKNQKLWEYDGSA